MLEDCSPRTSPLRMLQRNAITATITNMAHNAKVDLDDGAESDASSSSETSNNSDESNAVETLVAGRERRTNAGNRMNALVQEEEDKKDDQDEVALLFAQAEDEVDEEYTSEEAEEGDEFSSSDDEAENQNTAGDDLEGEKAVERQEKSEKAKKRKAALALTSGANLRKKVKIDPNLPQKSEQPKRPSKKGKSKIWTATEGEAVRQSSRAHTQTQAITTKVKLLEDEIRAAKYKEQREKKERQRQREQPEKEVTQADRLLEAGKIERRNLKSLNRWEESEKKRAEEQAAKLAALKDRSLNGPVVSWWSGKAVWLGPRLSLVGNKEVTFQARRTSIGNDEPKKRGRKSKALLDQQTALIEVEAGTPSMGTPRDGSMTPALSDNVGTSCLDVIEVQPPENANAPTVNHSQPSTVPIMQLPENSILQGIQEYATLHGQVPPLGAQGFPPLAAAPPLVQELPVINVEPEPVIIENSTRNLLILDNFEDLSSDGRKHFQVFYNKKAAKLSKPDREMCPITSSQARYRDPSTGIPYANSLAFKKLQELKKHQYTWSSMLDCFVGKAGVVARGVPESFLGEGVPMRDIQGQPYVRPAPLTVPPTPSHQPQPSAVA
jgi:vacuolar protein sorting-associated protein 72